MKTKFAKEKSEYSHCLRKFIAPFGTLEEKNAMMKRMQEIEQSIKKQGDEIIWIITTRDTNPMKDKCAPPMSQEDIKNT